jgi:hypothetical protein
MEVVEGENNVPCESKDGCLDVVPKRLVGAPLRILLVDDFAPFRESIRQLFNGYDALMVWVKPQMGTPRSRWHCGLSLT